MSSWNRPARSADIGAIRNPSTKTAPIPVRIEIDHSVQLIQALPSPHSVAATPRRWLTMPCRASQITIRIASVNPSIFQKILRNGCSNTCDMAREAAWNMKPSSLCERQHRHRCGDGSVQETGRFATRGDGLIYESSCNCGRFPRTSAEVHTSGCRILKEGSSHEALCRT